MRGVIACRGQRADPFACRPRVLYCTCGRAGLRAHPARPNPQLHRFPQGGNRGWERTPGYRPPAVSSRLPAPAGTLVLAPAPVERRLAPRIPSGGPTTQLNNPLILGKSPRPESKAKVMGRNGTPIGDVRHGHALRGVRSSTYYSWQNMLARCRHASVPSYPRYGGRGIKVCDRWGTFENFLDDMGERPPGLTLDRVDNDGNYEPGNCRWATRSEQIRHCRKDDIGRWA